MHRTRIKICGITNTHDAALAVAAGADAVGVIFAPSPRQVTVEQAVAALADVPPPVARVGVFVDPSAEQVARAVEACGLTAVQLSGHESPEVCDLVPVPVLKAIHIGTDFPLEMAEPYRGHAAALLLDTLVPGKAGGTSQAFNWLTLGVLPGWAPSFIAGGLKPDNIAACVAALRPFAVDVSSGVEASPGIKDPDKIVAFCAAVRGADQEV
ncbi:MAG: phosphoribosylanthranilate isomerase [Coriobacteriia bacterium]|nr:phosphoribosylanthranilate isomerase [Coriobacteriia bacterium]